LPDIIAATMITGTKIFDLNIYFPFQFFRKVIGLN